MLGQWCVIAALCTQVDAVPDARFSAPLPASIRVADESEIAEAIGSAALSLHVLDERGQFGEPIWGRFYRRGERIVFTPRFPLDPAVSYRLRYLDERGQPHIAVVPNQPRVKNTDDFRVIGVYPSADVLPANLLKFYIHFSAPVREGREIFEHVSLVDELGVPIAAPWLLTELWSADARRLTLRIHPGRVKQGVNLRETEGMVLQPGKRYTLRVSRDVQQATAGQGRIQLAAEYVKSFRVSDEDHTLPEVARWKVVSPRAGSHESLVIQFPEPLDPHLARRCIAVHDQAGNRVVGEIAIDSQETRWLLLPEQPWSSGAHQIVVDEVLEDLAGNTPTRPFEVNANEPLPRLPNKLEFTPRPQ